MTAVLELDVTKSPDWYCANLSKWIIDNTLSLPSDEDTVRDHIEQLYVQSSKISATDSNWQLVSEVERVIRGYIRSKLSEKYPLIPKKVFELKRWLHIDSTNLHELKIIQDVLSLPENVQMKVTKNRQIVSVWVPIDLVATSLDWSKDETMFNEFNFFKDKSLFIRTRFPSLVTKDVLDTQLAFVKDMQNIINGILAWDKSQLLIPLNRIHTLKPPCKVGWIPTKDSLSFSAPKSPPLGDPIYFCEFAGGSFLLAEWQIAEEHPLVSALDDMLLF